jgi:hypothetical protein
MQMTLNQNLRSSGLLACLLLAACGGASSGSGDFQLLAISVPENGQWKINRPIEFTFSKAVDFSSVDSNSLVVRTPEGQAALGEYTVKVNALGQPIPEVIVFQPRCPLLGDFSDAGLIPNGQSYLIEAIGSDVSIGLSVLSQDGDVLGLTQRRNFTTALGSLPSELFLDTVIGAPTVVLRPEGVADDTIEATHIRLRDTGERRYFERLPNGTIQIEPFSEAEPNFPINLFSDSSQQLDLVLVFNQSVSPETANVSSDRVRLESRPNAGSPWVERPAEVVLEANCTPVGSRVRVRPVGVLPQQHEFRVVVSADFSDIVGDQGLLAQDSFGRFSTQKFPSPYPDGSDPDPDTIVDELFESYDAGGSESGSNEDTAPNFIEPLAAWGDGRLEATFDFQGTGGPGGDFDYLVKSGETVLFSTDIQTITGGPGFTATATQVAVNGVLNVRNLRIEDGGRLLFTGPNPAKILATGTVEVFGEIDISGVDSEPVAQLNSPNIPQPGAAGNGGGGKGGRGSPFTTTSTPKGENGFGPFDVANGGGVGGESGFNEGGNEEQRRGAGGGGGRLATEYVSLTDSGFQVNARLGGLGASTAQGALTFQSPPQPGAFGPAAFIDTNPNGTLNTGNDYFGTAVDGVGTIIPGELPAPVAGSGGGGGGDSINSSIFPSAEFILNKERKGGGGGGGAGQLQILALDTVRFGANGQILCNGGRGGEGESTGGTNQIGGAGGGGSGGHVIVQAGIRLDFSANPVAGAVQAISGQGGKGQGDGTNNSTPAALGSGGDGGGGVIQFHVPDFVALDPLDPPSKPGVLLPSPLPPGVSNVQQYLDFVSAPNAKRLVPTFSPKSRARSKPIPLGSLGDNTPGIPPLFALFGLSLDTDPLDPEDDSGFILTTADAVDPVEPLLSRLGGAAAPAGTTLEVIDFDQRIVTLRLSSAAVDALSEEASAVPFCYKADGTWLECDDPDVSQIFYFKDDSYLRNTALLRQSRLVLDDAGTGSAVNFTVALAEAELVDPLDPAQGQLLHLFLEPTEGSLVNFIGQDVATIDFILNPRFFRVVTSAQNDTLPAGQLIQIRAQTLRADANGDPDLASPLTNFTGDLRILSEPISAGEADFIRFDVLFDLGTGVDGNTPRPRLEFLRLPIRF